MLSKETREQIIRRFPKIELSYEKLLHKKVPADIYMLIPKGHKVFIWLTSWQEKNICLSIARHNNETKIYDYSCKFSNDCARGTILYGTLFEYNKKKHFSCEDIFAYKGNPIGVNASLEDKFKMYKDLFINKHITPHLPQQELIIGLPIFCDNAEDAFKIQGELPYMVYSIQLHDSNVKGNHRHHKIGAYLVKYGMPDEQSAPLPRATLPAAIAPSKQIYTPISSDIILKVRACLHDDMYNLFCLDTMEKEKYIGIAMIPSYKSSVMMNTLFRNIKENGNLDLLEESDDEDDFENIGENKYVDLEKTLLMKCVYSKRFKKWQPLTVFNGNEKAIISYSELKKRE